MMRAMPDTRMFLKKVLLLYVVLKIQSSADRGGLFIAGNFLKSFCISSDIKGIMV